MGLTEEEKSNEQMAVVTKGEEKSDEQTAVVTDVKKKDSEPKYKINKFITSVIVMVIGTPMIVSFLMEREFMDWGTQKAESWMSFWGGYLGAFIGLLAVLYTTNKQIKSSKMLLSEQIKEQTKQIEISANLHDDLERKRVHINTLLEKNLEIQKIIRELQKIFTKNIKKCDEIFEKVIEMNSLFTQRDILKRTLGPEMAINENNKRVISERQNYNELKISLSILVEEFQDASNRLYTYKVFIDLENDQSSDYATQISELIDHNDKIIEYITMLSENYIYGDLRKLGFFKEKIKNNKETIEKIFDDLNILSVSHINSLLNALVGR